MDEYIKFHNQTAGRDKFFRLVQYTSRFVWASLESKKSNPMTIERAKRIDEVLGLMRRMLRFGRFFETLHSAMPMISSNQPEPTVRFTIAMSRISNACFMLIDHIVCLDKLGILPTKLIDSSKWDKTSTKFWLYAILLGLIRDAHEILKIIKSRFPSKIQRSHWTPKSDQVLESEETKEKSKNKRSIVVQCLARVEFTRQIICEHADIAIDSTKNICDLFLPLNSLGFVRLSPMVIGLLGVLSTILSVIPQINPMVKMVPGS